MKRFGFLKPLSISGKIRVGPHWDGGYVVYQPVLKNIEVLVTYGVGWEAGFEVQLNEISGCRVFMFDPSMFGRYLLDLGASKRMLINGDIKKLAKYFDSTWRMWLWLRQMQKRKILFVNEGLGVKKGIKYDTFKNHLTKYGLLNCRVFLKIDIEGGEYDILEKVDMYQDLAVVSQIIIEFHDLHLHFSRFEGIIFRLRENYEIVHIHGNNWGGEFNFKESKNNSVVQIPKVLEITLVRKGEIDASDIVNDVSSYPTDNIDFPNNPNIADLGLDFIEY